MVYLELPEVGRSAEGQETFGTVESVKAVSELFAPVAGEVVEVNTALVQSPETINTDPYGEAWMIAVKLADPEGGRRASWTPPPTRRSWRASRSSRPMTTTTTAKTTAASLAPGDTFPRRHIGPDEAEVGEMLATLGLAQPGRAGRRHRPRGDPARAARSACPSRAGEHELLDELRAHRRRGTRSSARSSAWATTTASPRR